VQVSPSLDVSPLKQTVGLLHNEHEQIKQLLSAINSFTDLCNEFDTKAQNVSGKIAKADTTLADRDAGKGDELQQAIQTLNGVDDEIARIAPLVETAGKLVREHKLPDSDKSAHRVDQMERSLAKMREDYHRIVQSLATRNELVDQFKQHENVVKAELDAIENEVNPILEAHLDSLKFSDSTDSETSKKSKKKKTKKASNVEPSPDRDLNTDLAIIEVGFVLKRYILFI
jgi:uncharacterized phage infection (PIP) family protein YhgE